MTTKKQPLTKDTLLYDKDVTDPEVKKELLEKNGIGEFQLLQAHKPSKANREAVIAMRIAELTQRKIADVLEISEKTLVKYYGREITLAKDMTDQLVISKLMEGIKAGDPKLIQFYLKNKKNWNDKQEHVVTHQVIRPRKDIEEELRALGVPEENLKDI